MSMLRVAVAQYNVPLTQDVAVAKLDEMAKRAAEQGAALLVAPETSIGALEEAKTGDDDNLAKLQDIAQRRQTAIATSFYSHDGGKIFNQGYVISSSGETAHTHRKLYLAQPEITDGVTPGHDLTVSQTDLGKIGMLICKDGFTRYSHFLYDKFSELGSELLVVPSWSLGWEEHNTQAYIRALFTYGAFASRSFVLVAGNLNSETASFGRSLIISPIHGVLQEATSDEETLLVQDLDLCEVQQARDFDAKWQPPSRLF